MADPAVPRRTSVVRCAVRSLGALLLGVTAWQMVGLFALLPRYATAQTFWLALGVHLALWLPCAAGGLALLRGRTTGFAPLYFVAAVLVAGELTIFVPPAYGTSAFARFGGVAYSWPIVLALLAVSLLGFVISRYLPSPAAAADGSRRWHWAGLYLALAWLYVGCTFARQRVGRGADEAAQQAFAAYEAGRHAEAVAVWEHVIDAFPCTSAWGAAVLGTGADLCRQHQYRAAIARFEMLLGSGVDDDDPDGNCAPRARVYRYQACLELASCQEALGDYAVALHYATLARDWYTARSQSGCGTCVLQMQQELEERIARLERKRAGGE